MEEAGCSTENQQDRKINGDKDDTQVGDITGDNSDEETLVDKDDGQQLRRGSVKKQEAGPFNCPEKIVIFLDISTDWDNTAMVVGRGMSRNEVLFQLVKKAIAIFLTTKSTINPRHQFALVLLQDNDVLWYQEFTNDVQLFLEIMADLELSETDHGERSPFSMDQMLAILEDHCELPSVQEIALPPDYVIRALFIYGRSNCDITCSDAGSKVLNELHQSPYFFLDSLYIHEEPSELNQCETIHSFLHGLNSNGSGYVLDVCNDSTILFEKMAKLLAHPLQRMVTGESYSLSSKTDGKTSVLD